MNSFNMAMAIKSALSNSGIHRLKHTFEALSKPAKKARKKPSIHHYASPLLVSLRWLAPRF